MAADFHNPISKAVRPEDTAKTLSEYRHGQARGKEEYALMVKTFYALITDFYEFGWGRSWHFAPTKGGASFEESIAGHQYFLGDAMGLRPGMKVLDIGCGVGGPQRALAKKFGSSIVGLNIDEYQIKKCSTYNRKASLDHLCSVLSSDFMDMPAEDQSFDAAYHIESIPHAPDADPQTPWYRPMEGSSLTLRSLPRTALGCKITSAALRVLEGVRAVPGGSFEVQETLNIAANSLVAAGRLGIFTPMYFHKARKPG